MDPESRNCQRSSSSTSSDDRPRPRPKFRLKRPVIGSLSSPDSAKDVNHQHSLGLRSPTTRDSVSYKSPTGRPSQSHMPCGPRKVAEAVSKPYMQNEDRPTSDPRHMSTERSAPSRKRSQIIVPISADEPCRKSRLICDDNVEAMKPRTIALSSQQEAVAESNLLQPKKVFEFKKSASPNQKAQNRLLTFQNKLKNNQQKNVLNPPPTSSELQPNHASDRPRPNVTPKDNTTSRNISTPEQEHARVPVGNRSYLGQVKPASKPLSSLPAAASIPFMVTVSATQESTRLISDERRLGKRSQPNEPIEEDGSNVNKISRADFPIDQRRNRTPGQDRILNLQRKWELEKNSPRSSAVNSSNPLPNATMPRSSEFSREYHQQQRQQDTACPQPSSRSISRIPFTSSVHSDGSSTRQSDTMTPPETEPPPGVASRLLSRTPSPFTSVHSAGYGPNGAVVPTETGPSPGVVSGRKRICAPNFSTVYAAGWRSDSVTPPETKPPPGVSSRLNRRTAASCSSSSLHSDQSYDSRQHSVPEKIQQSFSQPDRLYENGQQEHRLNDTRSNNGLRHSGSECSAVFDSNAIRQTITPPDRYQNDARVDNGSQHSGSERKFNNSSRHNALDTCQSDARLDASWRVRRVIFEDNSTLHKSTAPAKPRNDPHFDNNSQFIIHPTIRSLDTTQSGAPIDNSRPTSNANVKGIPAENSSNSIQMPQITATFRNVIADANDSGIYVSPVSDVPMTEVEPWVSTVDDNNAEYDMEWDPTPADLNAIVNDAYEIRQQLNPEDETVSKDIVPLTTQDEYMIVIDTNIFLAHLRFVESLRDTHYKALGNPKLIVSWIVLQELDHLKVSKFFPDGKISNPITQLQANKAIHWINSSFRYHTDKVQGDTDFAENALKSKLKGDDGLILTALHLKSKDKTVILLTNDINLQNKACLLKILTKSKEELEKDLRNNSIERLPVAPSTVEPTSETRPDVLYLKSKHVISCTLKEVGPTMMQCD